LGDYFCKRNGNGKCSIGYPSSAHHVELHPEIRNSETAAC